MSATSLKQRIVEMYCAVKPEQLPRSHWKVNAEEWREMAVALDLAGMFVVNPDGSTFLMGLPVYVTSDSDYDLTLKVEPKARVLSCPLDGSIMRHAFLMDRYECPEPGCSAYIPSELLDRWLNPEKYA